ncbi:MAG: hypothetical protein WCV73_05165 [Patescibacteria group bacterium]|jgi:hypothetical protein
MKKILKDAVMWGFVLWLIGYGLGIILFFFVPANLLGWVIMPIGILITLWVLLKKVSPVKSLQEQGASQFNGVNPWTYYLTLAIVWTIIAVICDYFFLVKLLNPADGYYKLDVYLYYIITLILPLLVGWWKNKGEK